MKSDALIVQGVCLLYSGNVERLIFIIPIVPNIKEIIVITTFNRSPRKKLGRSSITTFLNDDKRRLSDFKFTLAYNTHISLVEKINECNLNISEIESTINEYISLYFKMFNEYFKVIHSYTVEKILF